MCPAWESALAYLLLGDGLCALPDNPHPPEPCSMDPYEYAFKLKTYLGQVIPNFAGIAFRQDTTVCCFSL